MSPSTLQDSYSCNTAVSRVVTNVLGYTLESYVAVHDGNFGAGVSEQSIAGFISSGPLIDHTAHECVILKRMILLTVKPKCMGQTYLVS